MFKVRGWIIYGFKGSKAAESKYPIGRKAMRVIPDAISHEDAISKLTTRFEESSNNKGQHTNLRFEGIVFETDGGKIVSKFQTNVGQNVNPTEA